jgi:small subunit ribosomal protein S1
MATYIPPREPPSEAYWLAVLEEGPVSRTPSPGPWEWVRKPDIPPSVWEEARQLAKSRCPVQLTIEGYNRGGLIAHWKGIEAFIPASHLLDYPFPADLEKREEAFRRYVGKEMALCLLEVDPGRRRLLLSEREASSCQPIPPDWPEWLCVGQKVEGTVTSVRPFGAFVDIGPLEGMIHISEISWRRVRDPLDFLKPGDEVEVLIIHVDTEHHRVGLSMKRLQPNPWDRVHEALRPGDVVEGTVVSVERFGVFVELHDGLEGLLHVSALRAEGDERPLEEDFRVGEKVRVRVVEIIPQEHRIALLPVEPAVEAMEHE